MHVYMYVYVNKHTNNTYMCMYIHICMMMYVCLYVHMYIYIYVHVHTWFYTLMCVASLQGLLDVLLANHDMKLVQHCRASMFWQLLPAGPGGTINERSIWFLKYKTHQKPIGMNNSNQQDRKHHLPYGWSQISESVGGWKDGNSSVK